MYYPIVVFAYNRVEHLKKTINALLLCEEAKHSDFFLFCDGYKSSVKEIQNVRDYANEIDGFKSTTIINSEINLGLAASIVNGVTLVLKKYDAVIVLEDDLVVSTKFLKYMNESLDYYKNNDLVWHISGWSYPGLVSAKDVFCWRVMNCWGWGTWKEKWIHFNKEPLRITNNWTKDQINKFNLDGYYDFYNQITQNATGKKNTWAVFWYATIFENDGLCINPTKTLVYNIGMDGSGTNSGLSNIYTSYVSNTIRNISLCDFSTEDKKVVRQIKIFYLKTIYKRIVNRIFKCLKIRRNLV